MLLRRYIRGSQPWVLQPRARVGRRQSKEGATRCSRDQVTKDAATAEHRSLGCNNFLEVCPIRHAQTVGCMDKIWEAGIQILQDRISLQDTS